ncbi:MAG TPA: hypothetical protein VK034_15835 [Enhygromyxa sp.]|nr:hypothetical protein [Enhygromyxa sp.]
MLLLSCCASSSAAAREPEPKPATDVVALELRELGEAASNHEFVVPLDGRIAGWTELYGERHYCRLDSDRTNDSRVSLRLRCGRGRDLQQLDFDFQVIRALEAGEPTLLAELTPQTGARIQVVATRR